MAGRRPLAAPNAAMSRLTDYTSYADAHRHFSTAALWELFDGDRDVAQHRARVRGPPRRRPTAWPCASPTPTAATRSSPSASCREWSARFAHWLRGPRRRRRATAWRSCSSRRWPSTPRSSAPSSAAPSRCRSSRCSAPTACGCASRTARRGSSSRTPRRRTRRAASRASTWSWPTTRCSRRSRPIPRATSVRSAPDDLAVFQYTSGTTRELPAAVRHTHRAIVVLMVAALYGTGIRPGDRFFCPSSPGLGPRTLARHAGAARPRRDHGHHGGQVRSRAPAAGAPGLRDHRRCRPPRPTTG